MILVYNISSHTTCFLWATKQHLFIAWLDEYMQPNKLLLYLQSQASGSLAPRYEQG